MPAELVLHVLEQALTRRPALSLIIHVDLGSQSPVPLPCPPRPSQCSAQLQPTPQPLCQRTLKTELLPGSSPSASLEEVRLEVAWHLDTYFNLDHRHSALGCRIPYQFEHDLKSNLR